MQLHNPLIDWISQKVTLGSNHCRTSCYRTSQDSVLPLSCAVVSSVLSACIPEEYAEFHDVFDEKRATRLPPNRAFGCKIELIPGMVLPCSRIYALSEPEVQHLRKYLDDMLDLGFIRHSTSPVSSPLFFVP